MKLSNKTLSKKARDREEFVRLNQGCTNITVHEVKEIKVPIMPMYSTGIILSGYMSTLLYGATFVAKTPDGENVVLTEMYQAGLASDAHINQPFFELNHFVTIQHRLLWLRHRIPGLKVKVYDQNGVQYPEELLEHKRSTASEMRLMPWIM